MKLFGASLLGLSMLALAGCGEDSPGPTRSAYPRDNELRMNQLQLKGTHNSYHIAQDPPAVPELAYSFEPLEVQLEDQGVRKFELDTNYMEATDTIEVFHILIVDEGTHCRQFVDCLRTIEKWSSQHPGHVPLFIQIEPKGRFPEWLGESFFEKFEGEILKAFPRERIVAPDDVQGDAATLREAVTERGWPALGAARGKVLFFINDRSDFTGAYTRNFTSLAGRLMFAESEPDEDFAAVRILNGAVDDFDAIQAAVRDGFIVRTRDGGAESPQVLQSALDSGAQIISTDYPAMTGGEAYFVQIPGGTPARCNPLIAPESCSSADIESPSRLK
ncbi:MAG: Ca2+-dependent phosphoinositide-specific phospholipase C [Polyangiaceae bacterium]